MKSIIFNTDEVQATLTGRKSQARRVVKPQLPENTIKIGDVDPLGYLFYMTNDRYLGGYRNRKVPFAVRNILYVRETWCGATDGTYRYKADIKPDTEKIRQAFGVKWHPSTHMPEEAARIFLKVTDVWVERLQDMTQEDCIKEGYGELSEEQYAQFWNSKIKKKELGKYGWEANPWVEVTEFEVISKEEAYGTGN